MALPAGHHVAKEIRRSVDPHQTTKRSTGPSRLAPLETATVVTGDIVAGHEPLPNRRVTRYMLAEAIYCRFNLWRPLQPIADAAEDRHRISALIRCDHPVANKPAKRFIREQACVTRLNDPPRFGAILGFQQTPCGSGLNYTFWHLYGDQPHALAAALSMPSHAQRGGVHRSRRCSKAPHNEAAFFGKC